MELGRSLSSKRSGAGAELVPCEQPPLPPRACCCDACTRSAACTCMRVHAVRLGGAWKAGAHSWRFPGHLASSLLCAFAAGLTERQALALALEESRRAAAAAAIAAAKQQVWMGGTAACSLRAAHASVGMRHSWAHHGPLGVCGS